MEQLGMSLESDRETREERARSLAYTKKHYKDVHGDDMPRAVQQEVRRIDALLRSPEAVAQNPFTYTRIGEVRQFSMRRSGVVDRYLLTLEGLGSAYCPAMCKSHREPCQILVDAAEGCQYRCQDPQCTHRYPFLKTAAFLRYQSMLFEGNRSTASGPPR